MDLDRLAAVPVTDPAGHEVALGSLWASRAVVLVFIRHFG
jgi:hypothetical protein